MDGSRVSTAALLIVERGDGTENALPAAAVAGAPTVNVEAAAGETLIVPLVPVIELVSVSVAVSVWLPDC